MDALFRSQPPPAAAAVNGAASGLGPAPGKLSPHGIHYRLYEPAGANGGVPSGGTRGFFGQEPPTLNGLSH